MIFLFANIIIVLGTTLGSFLINVKNKYIDMLMSLSIGIMSGTLIFSLLLESINNIENKILFLLFFIGGYFLIYLISKTSKNGNRISFTLSMVLHNIPEGLSIGIMYLSYKKVFVYFSYVFSIALQNIIDGMIVSMYLHESGVDKRKSIFVGVLTGLIEPIASFLAFYFINSYNYILPYMLIFAGGATLYVVFNDLVFYNEKIKNKEIYFLIGFIFIFIFEFLL